MAEQLIGHVTHWYGRAMVAGIHMDRGELHAGDVLHVLGHTSDVEQRVGSMEIDHHHVDDAHPGEDIGVKMSDQVREHDLVYRVLH